MPKKRQIPRLFSSTNAAGETIWHWKPSKTLRAAGFIHHRLGTDQALAVGEALALNAQVDAWRSADNDDAVPARRAPRLVRLDELIARYQASSDFTDLRASTQREYRSRLRQLETWFRDRSERSLPVRDMDKPIIRDLRTKLLKGSRYRAAATLRVLRLLLSWAVLESIIADNPAMEIDVPEPPRRTTMMAEPVRGAIVAAGDIRDGLDVELAIELGFWTIQRMGDIISLGRMAWREIPNVDSRYAATLANAKGRVMGFRLRQRKTGAWIDAPVPPDLHDTIESTMAASAGGWLFAHPDHDDRPMPDWLFGRRFRAARDRARDRAAGAGDTALAEAIAACQYRDLRRTGMTFYSGMGAKLPWITALSGHAVIGRKTILDTYMPGNTEAACACVATGVAGRAAQRDREKVE